MKVYVLARAWEQGGDVFLSVHSTEAGAITAAEAMFQAEAVDDEVNDRPGCEWHKASLNTFRRPTLHEWWDRGDVTYVFEYPVQDAGVRKERFEWNLDPEPLRQEIRRLNSGDLT